MLSLFAHVIGNVAIREGENCDLRSQACVHRHAPSRSVEVESALVDWERQLRDVENAQRLDSFANYVSHIDPNGTFIIGMELDHNILHFSRNEGYESVLRLLFVDKRFDHAGIERFEGSQTRTYASHSTPAANAKRSSI